MAGNSLAEALPAEMTRVRDELLPVYDSIPSGVFAATLMRQALDRAQKAMTTMDVVEMVLSYKELREFKL